MTNEKYLKQLDGLDTKYYDVKSAVEDITPGSFAKLNYTSRVLAENLLRKCPSVDLKDSLIQIPDDLVKGASAWALGQIGGHSNKHANALATQEVLTHLLAVYIYQNST